MIPRASKHSVVGTAVGGEAIEVAVRHHTVRSDQPAAGDSAPTPLEMVSVALAACITLYVKRYCDGARLDASGIAVEVNPVWRADQGRIGRFEVLLHLPRAISAEHHQAIHAAASNCTVHHTLEQGAHISVKVRPSPAEGAGEPPRVVCEPVPV
jgi:uncharacterized OsmC-like protein